MWKENPHLFQINLISTLELLRKWYIQSHFWIFKVTKPNKNLKVMRAWFHLFLSCPNIVYLQETFCRNVSLIIPALSLVNSICCLCLSFDIYLIEYFMVNYNCLCLWPRMESLIQYQTSICLDVTGFFNNF